MRSAILVEPGQQLELRELPDPTPGHDEILVHVEACGVCHSDLHLADGDWQESLDRRIHPTILGHEVVGMVLGRGAGVRSIEKGQRIGVGWVGETCGRCGFCRDGHDNLCDERRITGIDRIGGFSTVTTVAASQAIVLPDKLMPVEAAPLFCAGVTVYRGMKQAGIEAGQRVAIFGVGGLGHIAVQLARMWRADCWAVDTDPRKLELAGRLGARHTVTIQEAKDAIAAAGGVNVAVVTAASTKAYADAVHCLRKRGTLVVVGLPNDPIRLIADDIATRELRIVGSAVGSREELHELLELAVDGHVRCVTEPMPLDGVNEALGRIRRGEVSGRLVLVP